MNVEDFSDIIEKIMKNVVRILIISKDAPNFNNYVKDLEKSLQVACENFPILYFDEFVLNIPKDIRKKYPKLKTNKNNWIILGRKLICIS